MVQFLSINFFSWISSIFVGFFKSSRFFCVTLYMVYSCAVRILHLVLLAFMWTAVMSQTTRNVSCFWTSILSVISLQVDVWMTVNRGRPGAVCFYKRIKILYCTNMTFFLYCSSHTDNVQLNLTQGNLYLYNLTFQAEIKSQKSGLFIWVEFWDSYFWNMK